MSEFNHKTIKNKTSFFTTAIVIFLCFTAVLYGIDFVPEPTTNAASIAVLNSAVYDESQQPLQSNVPEEEEVIESTIPTRIVINSITLDASIITPTSADITVLDNALLSGAVHYPGSGLLGENANMLLFGHSSYLPVVQNKAFKAFNELGKIKKNDTIVIYSETHRYIYLAETVALSEAQDVLVHFESEKPVLTLATCNTFGKRQERWIVTARFIAKEVL